MPPPVAPVLHVDIDGLGALADELFTVVEVVEHLRRPMTALQPVALPAAEEVAADDVDVVLLSPEEGSLQLRQLDPVGHVAERHLALQVDGIQGAALPVEPAPGSDRRPLVSGVAICAVGGGVRAGELEVATVLAAVGRPAVPEAEIGALLGARRSLDEGALGVGGVLGDDVDDAVDGIRPPEGCPRSADDLDALDVGQHDVELLPVHTGERWLIHRATIDLDQELVGESLVEAARRDRTLAGVDPSDLHPRNQAQQLRKARGAGTLDVVLGEDANRRRRLRHGLLGPRRQGDLHGHELLDAHRRKVEGQLLSAHGWRGADGETDGGDESSPQPPPLGSGPTLGARAGWEGGQTQDRGFRNGHRDYERVKYEEIKIEDVQLR
jgi:hypothetical protein